MPRCCRPLPAFAVVFLVQAPWTTTATLLGREASSSDVSARLQARGTNVLDDKYFIPAIAGIGAFVLLSLVCLYFLGCCCNSKKMDMFYGVAARPAVRDSAAYQSPVNLNRDGSDRYSNVSPTKTPPPPAQVLSNPPFPSPRLEYPDANLWHNGNRWPSMAPPSSHGFQPMAHTAIPPSVMSISHHNPTVASYQNREYERSQMPRPLIPPDPRRISSMSSTTSSTQIGSGAGEQAPYVYSPHQGNTLSYASSTNPSVVAPVWDGSAVQRMPGNGDSPPMVAPELQSHYYSTVAPGQQGQYHQHTPSPLRPPAYIDTKGHHPVDTKKS